MVVTALAIHSIGRQRPEVLEEVKRRRRFTWMTISQHAQVTEVSEGTLVLTFTNAGARDSFLRGGSDDVLRDALVLAAEIFESTLNAPVGAKARGYLSDRGVDPAAQRLFGLGYSAPDRFALREALAARGVDLAEMIAAGLLAHGEDVAVAYDRFRDRVMFPIHDRGGKLVAFGGRALDPSAKAKYLNSPESELFHKGELLYNHHRAAKRRTSAAR